MRQIKALIIWAAVVAVLAAAGVIFSKTYYDLLAEGRRPLEVILPVRLGAEARIPVLDGRVEAKRRLPLAFAVGGQIEKICVQTGQQVKAGELIAVLEHQEALLAREKASLAVQAAQLGPEAEKRRAKLTLAEAELAVERAHLRAPFPGVVANLQVEENQFVSPGQPIAILLDTTGYVVRAKVSERDLPRLKVGQDVEVEIDALPNEKLTGTLVELGAEAAAGDQPVSRGSLLPVTIALPQHPGLLSGLSAQADILVPRAPWALDVAGWVVAALFLAMLVNTFLLSRLTIPQVEAKANSKRRR